MSPPLGFLAGAKAPALQLELATNWASDTYPDVLLKHFTDCPFSPVTGQHLVFGSVPRYSQSMNASQRSSDRPCLIHISFKVQSQVCVHLFPSPLWAGDHLASPPWRHCWFATCQHSNSESSLTRVPRFPTICPSLGGARDP